MEKIPYSGWPNCYRLFNETVDLVVTTDVGPRIIRFGFLGEENEFGENPEYLGKIGGNEWRNYGGHRLWHAPEAKPRSYFPDNSPIQATPTGATPTGNTLHLLQPTETATGIQKEMEVTLSPTGTHVTIVHRLRNNGLWPIEVSAWALTVMAQNGRAIIPQEPFISHSDRLLPVRPLVLWAYTDMSDPRWTWGEKYILLQQDPQATTPQKAGVGNRQGWMAYARAEHLFLKWADYQEGATYPDFGCSAETYTNAAILELETLSPLTKLEPGAPVEHTEHWFLYKNVTIGEDEESIDRAMLPLVQEMKQAIRK